MYIPLRGVARAYENSMMEKANMTPNQCQATAQIAGQITEGHRSAMR
jgi:hypothetical protein